MSTVMTRDASPESAQRVRAMTALEKALGRPLSMWESDDEGLWRAAPPGELASEAASCPPEQLAEVCDAAIRCAEPATRALGPRRRLLAVPLSAPGARPAVAAAGVFPTDDDQSLLRLTALAQSHYCTQQEIARLSEENRQFLQQITDDFEELTFLRSVAGRLNLADTSGSVEQLIRDAASPLGTAVRAESLFFIDTNTAGDPRVAVEWAVGAPAIEASQALRLADQFAEDAQTQPVIKNYFNETADGHAFPGVREFVLASVTTRVRRIGWFLLVNRTASAGGPQRRSAWRLSQLEFGTSEAFLLSTLGAMVASHESNLSLFRERESLLVSVVRTLVSAIEAKDVYTCGHSERVALYARRLAERIGYSDDQSELLYLTGLLHDVGKIAVSDAVLNKPGVLSDDEFAEIKRHPDEGWKILQGLKQLSYVLPGVLHHHERPDGRGYPDGLTGEQIPMDGRVLAVADAYDAMTSDRPYRAGMSQDEAERALREGAGAQWDADLIDAFFQVMPDIIAIRRGYQSRKQPVRRATPPAAPA